MFNDLLICDNAAFRASHHVRSLRRRVGCTLDGGVYEQSGSDMFVRSLEERAEDARRMLEAPECEETKGRVGRPCART